MAAPNFTVADFRRALLALFPTGPIWSREPGGLLYQLCNAWAGTYQRCAASATQLLADAFPATTAALLPEWQASLGLPDPCAGNTQSTELARNQVVARLTDNGGASAAYYVAFAKTLGYDITIKTHAPARAGQLRAGQPVNGRDWAFVWTVSADGVQSVPFRAGQSAAGDPLQSWEGGVLVCELQSRAPAHTILQFDSSVGAVLGAFTLGSDVVV